MQFTKVQRRFAPAPIGERAHGIYLIHLDEPLGNPEGHQARHYIGASDNLRKRILCQLKGKSGAAAMLRFAKRVGIDARVARVLLTHEDKVWEIERRLKDRKMGARYCPICNPLAGAITFNGEALSELDDVNIKAFVEIPF